MLSRHQFYVFLLPLFSVVWNVKCNDEYLDEKVCGTLYSGDNTDGEAFVLKDWDRTVNLRKDYRTSPGGSPITRSAKLEENCGMVVCSETYFQGNCRSLKSAPGVHQLFALMTPAVSANCTCTRDLSCADIVIPKNTETGGKAYFSSDCKSKYIQLRLENDWTAFPAEHQEAIQAIVIRSGCHLTYYPEEDKKGHRKVIKNQVVQDFRGKIGEYKFTCDEAAYVAPPRPESYPPLLPLHALSNRYFSLLQTNESVSSHPGVRAAIKSASMGRSSRNAYILLIGTYSPNNINLWNCSNAGAFKIGECHITVEQDKLGITKAQLRVIYVPITYKNAIDDARWVASLEDYLSKHDELSDAVPNAVVIFHYPLNDDKISEKGSHFQRKLQAVNALRGRILDESYSNFIILLWGLEHLSNNAKRNPSERLGQFETAMEATWKFPRPLFVVPRMETSLSNPKHHGHWRMANGEYWPRNFQEKLMLIAEKTGDELGRSIFQQAFPAGEKPLVVTARDITGDVLPADHEKVLLYQQNFADDAALQALAGPFKEKLEKRKGIIAKKWGAIQGGGAVVAPEEGSGDMGNIFDVMREKLRLQKERQEEMYAKLVQDIANLETELKGEVQELGELVIALEDRQRTLEDRLNEEIKTREGDRDKIKAEVLQQITQDLRKLLK